MKKRNQPPTGTNAPKHLVEEQAEPKKEEKAEQPKGIGSDAFVMKSDKSAEEETPAEPAKPKKKAKTEEAATEDAAAPEEK